MDRINQLENEIADLRKILSSKENELYELKKAQIQVFIYLHAIFGNFELSGSVK